MLADWIRTLRPRTHRSPARRSKTRRPLLHSLEDRSVPSAFRVGSAGFDTADAVAADSAGNIYIAGTFNGTVDFDPGPGVTNLTNAGVTTTDDAYLAKYTAAGNLVWVGQLPDCAANGLAVDSAGAVYLTGAFPGTTDFDLGAGVSNLTTGSAAAGFVAKYNPDRSLAWADRFGGQTAGVFGVAITLDTAGNVYASGTTGHGDYDMDPGAGTATLTNPNIGGNACSYIAKLNPSGGYVWAKQFTNTNTGADGVWTAKLAVDSAQNVYVTGIFVGQIDFDTSATTTYTSGDTSGGDGYAAKLDANGNLAYLVTIGAPSTREDGYGIAVDAAGNAYVTGQLSPNTTVHATNGNTVLNSAGTWDLYLLKLDPTGALTWSWRTGSAGFETGSDILYDGAGNLYLTGIYSAATVDFDPGPGVQTLPYPGGSYSVFALKLKTDGTFVSAAGFGGTDYQYPYDMALTNTNQIVIAGRFNGTVDFDPGPGVQSLTSAGSSDIFVNVLDQVAGTNQPPVASNGTLTTDENTPANGTLVATDADGDPLTYAAVDVTNAHGMVTVTDTTGAYTYTPTPGFSGTATFTFKANDGQADSNIATVTITVNAVNHPPTATDGTGSTAEDTALSGSLSSTDPDGDNLTYTVVTGPGHGTLTAFDPATGAFTYTPAGDYNGPDSLTFKVNDGAVDSNTATFGITVTPVNDPPTADPIPNPAPVPEDSGQQTVTVTGLSAGPPDEAGQTLTVTAASSNTAIVPDPTVTYAGGDTATLTYTPVPDANGTATITVTVSDGTDSTVLTFDVQVGPVNDRPIIDTSFTPMLPPIKIPIPKGTFPTGGPISTLVAHVTDVDTGDIKGVAITGADTSKGKWEFTTDGGATWQPLPVVSPSSALLLADDGQTQVRFLPNKRAPKVKPFTKGFADFTYKAWDGSNGLTAGTQADTTAAGDTAYSTATEHAWVAVGKTVPTVDANGHPVLKAIKEDARQSPAYLVKNFLGLLARETDPAKVFGIALSGTTGTGSWEFNTGKGGWHPLGAVSDTQALLLRPTDRVRFKPGKDFDGDARLIYHTWDLVGTFGTKVDTTAGTDFSAATETAILDILPVNDAPVLDTTPNVTLGSVRPFWTTDPVSVSALLNGAATDVETPQANLGIYIVSAVGGTWEYTTDGTHWVTVTKPVYLAPTVQIRFTASPPGFTVGTLKYKAWDGTVMKPTATSKAVETATVAIQP
jgi:hypothetical protein